MNGIDFLKKDRKIKCEIKFLFTLKISSYEIEANIKLI